MDMIITLNNHTLKEIIKKHLEETFAVAIKECSMGFSTDGDDVDDSDILLIAMIDY